MLLAGDSRIFSGWAMAGQLAVSDDLPEAPRFADAFVIFSVTVLSLAVGAWLLLRLKLALLSGTAAALAVYMLLLALHLLLRRTFLYEPVPDPRGGWVSHAMARAALEGEEAPGRPLGEGLPRPPTLPDGRRRGAEYPAADGGGPRRGTGQDAFRFRPSREPGFASPPQQRGVADEPGAEPDAASSPMSVEVIQDLIKKLADELNSTPEGAPPAPELSAAERAAAREGDGRASAAPQQSGAAEAPQAPLTREAQLARIAEALTGRRVEMQLEPIHALAEGRPRHVEVSMRLIAADGASLDQATIQRTVGGAPLMPRIDSLRFTHAARVARRLGDRGRHGTVLVLVDGGSLIDEDFLAAAAAEVGTPVARRLVLSFTQAAVRTFTLRHTEVLKTLVAAGLRCALEEVVDLDMDLAALKKMGVDFVKLDAQQFLEGLPAAGGRVPAADICRHLGDYGLTLIVGSIEDEWLLARILGFGVQFGKGALFGAPRVVKDNAAAAAASRGEQRA
jgi:EAL domain-containing protein (putative c-di-GMP-specific phosphodiesterase class I)